MRPQQLERIGREARRHERHGQPARTAGQRRPHVRDHAHHLAKGQRRQREIMPLKPHRWYGDHQRRDTAERAARQHAQPRTDAEFEQQHRRRIGADAEERRVAERDLVGEAANNVPGLRHRGEQQREGENANPVAARIEQKRQQSCRQDQKRQRETAFHRLAPIRPCGRTASTRMKTTNNTRFCN